MAGLQVITSGSEYRMQNSSLATWFWRSRKRTHKQLQDEDRWVEMPNGEQVHVRQRVICLGDGCPKPQLLTLKALGNIEAGEVVQLDTDNPAIVDTIPAMMFAAEGEVIATVRDDGIWHLYVRLLAEG